MQGMSDQFFTGAGFAVNQHANRRTRKPTDNPEHVLHGWRFTDDIGRWAVKLNITRLLLFLVMTDGALNQRHGFVDIKRFGQIIKCPLLIGADGSIQIGMCGHNDDRKHRMALFNLLEQRQPVHSWHTDI